MRIFFNLLAILVLFYTCSSNTFGALYYRSLQSGAWHDPSNWETSENADFSHPIAQALLPPSYQNETIFIQNSHRIFIEQSVRIDQCTVNAGGTLAYTNTPSVVISIENGEGIDLLIEGRFEDHGPFNIDWKSSQARWALGNLGTMLRSRSTSAVLWRNHYHLGMATIPPTSTWIIQKNTIDNPSLSSINTYFGNLILENNTGTFWDATVVGSVITGSSSAPIIKGMMQLGQFGEAGIRFYIRNSFEGLVKINHSLVIQELSELVLDNSTTNGASGIDLGGDLILYGKLHFTKAGANETNRKVKFSGTTLQRIWATSPLVLHNFTCDKSSGTLLFETSIEVMHTCSLQQGPIQLNGNFIRIHRSSDQAIQRVSGYFIAEHPSFSSAVHWHIGEYVGHYIIPFGNINQSYIPLSITHQSGDLGVVSVSTYATTPENTPLPSFPSSVGPLSLDLVDQIRHAVDRFWLVQTTEPSAQVILSFRFAQEEQPQIENPLNAYSFEPVLSEWKVSDCCPLYQPELHTLSVQTTLANSCWALLSNGTALRMKRDLEENAIQSTAEDTYSLFPNPFSNTLSMRIPSKSASLLSYKVVDILGKVVVEKTKLVKTESLLVPIVLPEETPSGHYFFIIEDDTHYHHFRLIKEGD